MRLSMRFCGLLLIVLALMMTSVLAENGPVTPSDIEGACDHPDWFVESNESGHWYVCTSCGNVISREYGHFAVCAFPGVCVECGVPYKGNDIRHGGDIGWAHNDTYHWRACMTCGEEAEGTRGKHYGVCWEPGVCKGCGASYAGDNVEHDMGGFHSRGDGTHVWDCLTCGFIVAGPEPHHRLCDEEWCDFCAAPYTGSNIKHYPGTAVAGHDDTYHWFTCQKCGLAVKEKHFSPYGYNICEICGVTFTEAADDTSSSGEQTTTAKPTGNKSGVTRSGSKVTAKPTAGLMTVAGPDLYDDGLSRAVINAPRTGKASLRETAASNGKVLAQLVDGTVVVVLDRSGRYTKVSVGDVTGYLLTDALEMLDPEQRPLGIGMLTYPTTGGRGTTTVNVRSEASNRARKIGAWPTGTEVIVWGASKDERWYEIEYDNVRVYVSEQFLTITAIYDYSTKAEGDEAETEM